MKLSNAINGMNNQVSVGGYADQQVGLDWIPPSPQYFLLYIDIFIVEKKKKKKNKPSGTEKKDRKKDRN